MFAAQMGSYLFLESKGTSFFITLFIGEIGTSGFKDWSFEPYEWKIQNCSLENTAVSRPKGDTNFV